VVPAAAFECVVAAAVNWVAGTDDGAEDPGAAVWSAVPEVQLVTAKLATKTTVAMIRTGRMAPPPTTTTL
jgi:hypothetical protein